MSSREFHSRLDWIAWEQRVEGFRSLCLAVISISIGIVALELATEGAISDGLSRQLITAMILAMSGVASTFIIEVGVAVYTLVHHQKMPLRGLLYRIQHSRDERASLNGKDGSEDVKDPRRLFASLALVTILVALCLCFLIGGCVPESSERIEWWKIVISSASLLVSLLLGSVVAISAYGYVNRLSHDWKIRHDYAIERLNEIYGPLWDETKHVLKAVEAHYRPDYYDQGREYKSPIPAKGYAHIQRYKQLLDSHLILFLRKPLADSLKDFHDSADEYGSSLQELKDQIGTALIKRVTDNESLKDAEKTKKEDVARSMWADLQHDSVLGGIIFSLEPDLDMEAHYKKRLMGLLKDNLNVDDAAASEVVESELLYMRNNEGLVSLRSRRQICLHKGRESLGMLEEVIRRPESALD